MTCSGDDQVQTPPGAHCPKGLRNAQCLHVIPPHAGWQVSVAGHPLTLITLDARPLTPKAVDSFAFYGGNRVDAVLCTNFPLVSAVM